MINFSNNSTLLSFEIVAAKDAFNQFDKKGEGQLKVGDIAQAMKKLGHNIKPDWLEKMEDMIDTEGIPFDLTSISSWSGVRLLIRQQHMFCFSSSSTSGFHLRKEVELR